MWRFGRARRAVGTLESWPRRRGAGLLEVDRPIPLVDARRLAEQLARRGVDVRIRVIL